MDPAVLYPRRLAWRALRMALERFQLGDMALKLNPDDPTQALPGVEPGEVWFYEDFDRGAGKVVAIVLLTGTRARVLVERIERLIRRNHRRGFVPREVGIVQREGAFDVDLEVELAEVIESDEGRLMRTARQRVLPPSSRPRRPPTVIRAFGGSR